MPRASRIDRLVADGIENPKNARALIDAAAMFGVEASFRDRGSLRERWDPLAGAGGLTLTGRDWPSSSGGPIVALENTPGSDPVFGAAVRSHSSLVVGNERTGIGRDVLRAAQRTVHIPTAGRRLNTLNVAAAAAVGLYVLGGWARAAGPRTTAKPERHRPSLLLVAPTDHVEAGSALRSAAAFGWRTVALDDRHGMWFDTPREMRTEGRGASRSHRAALRVVRVRTEEARYERLVVASPSIDGPPLDRVRMTLGPNSAIAIPDGVDTDAVRWDQVAGQVTFARIPTALGAGPARFRFVASIVMAEIARQLGIRGRGERPSTRERLRYESAIRWPETAPTQELTWDELVGY